MVEVCCTSSFCVESFIVSCFSSIVTEEQLLDSPQSLSLLYGEGIIVTVMFPIESQLYIQ